MKIISRRSALGTLVSATFLGLFLPKSGRAEDQPRMKAALEHLEKAKAELDAASADKGGHRNKARHLVDQAIAEVKRGIRYDNRH